MSTSFRELIDSLPVALSEPLRVANAREWLQRCGSEALFMSTSRRRRYTPVALQKVVSNITALQKVVSKFAEPGELLDRLDSEDKARLTFAAIARLADEGYQPFLANLAPPDDSEYAELLPGAETLIGLVQQNERLYQEQASRWLVVAHCASQLLSYESANPGCFGAPEPGEDDDPMTIDQAVDLVSILNRWWPWVVVCEEAYEAESATDPSVRLRDRVQVYVDWKGLGAADLRPNSSTKRTSKRQRASKRRRRTSRRHSRRPR